MNTRQKRILVVIVVGGAALLLAILLSRVAGAVPVAPGESGTECCTADRERTDDVNLTCCCVPACCAPEAAAEETTNTVKLTDAEKTAMDALYIDEHQGRAVYYAIMEKFGEVRLFANIARSETNHIRALSTLYERYGVPYPEVVLEEAPDFKTLREAAEWSAQFERENAALYDKYLATTGKPGLIRVFSALRDASRYRHLPAFERAAARW